MDGGPSRTELQRWIENGGVKVNGVARKAADKLKEGVVIVVEPEPPPRSEAFADADVQFEVIYIDDALLVIDKPAGLVVHPAKGHPSGTLVNGLLARGIFDPPDDEDELNSRPSISSARRRLCRAKGHAGPAIAIQMPDGSPSDLDRTRPGIVHRLDKGTSGLMVVARHPRAREKLKVQFAEHSIEREYVALVVGKLAPKTFATLARPASQGSPPLLVEGEGRQARGHARRAARAFRRLRDVRVLPARDRPHAPDSRASCR